MSEPSRKLLIVEDDPGLLSQLKWCFEDYDVFTAGDRAGRRCSEQDRGIAFLMEQWIAEGHVLAFGYQQFRFEPEIIGAKDRDGSHRSSLFNRRSGRSIDGDVKAAGLNHAH